MESSHSGHEQVYVERIAALEQCLAKANVDLGKVTAERDEYKSRAEWLQQQLERLKYDAKTPREHVDPRQIQLVFEPFAQALLGTPAPDGAGAPAPDGEKKGKGKRKVTPHGRRTLPEHLPIETIMLTPSPLPGDAVPIGTEVSWRLGYRRAGYYRLRVLRPLYVVSKEAAATSTAVEAAMVEPTTPESASSGGSEQPPPATSSPSEPPMPDVTAETTTRLVPPTDDLLILPRSRGQSDYAAIASTCLFNSNSIGLT